LWENKPDVSMQSPAFSLSINSLAFHFHYDVSREH
jgi:hypothetical protein